MTHAISQSARLANEHDDAPDPEWIEHMDGAVTSTRELVSPTSEEPLRGLVHLAKVATVGRTRLMDLARERTHYVWHDIAVGGTIVLLASGPSEGKTTLLFLILAARATLGIPVTLLARGIEPAARGKYIVLIEGEHSESSAARKLIRSMRILGIDDGALDRIILIARKSVRLGSPEWDDIVRLVRAGLVSDIAIDTVARVAPGAADDEREQVAIFDGVAQAIEAAPADEEKPIVWACAHTRKNGRTGDVADVSGSTQRVGQADSVLMLAGEKVDGRTVATRVVFGKLREEPEEYPSPVTFSIRRVSGREELSETDSAPAPDGSPLEERILALLAAGPKTKTALRTELRRNDRDVEEAISVLFSAKRISTTTITIRGKSTKAFTAKTGRTLAVQAPPHDSSDEVRP